MWFQVDWLCRDLVPVTQLYVSVDASTKDSLKKIDRPLFRDFWPRFLSSLDELNKKVLRDTSCRTCLGYPHRSLNLECPVGQ